MNLLTSIASPFATTTATLSPSATVTTHFESSSPQLYRYNRYAAATFSAAPAPGYTIGQGIEAMNDIAREVLDDSYVTSLSGTSKEFTESAGSLVFAFL
ncbi:MAG: hypothetical protein R2795_18065 [Saprospiraceae bacterium]